VPGRSASTRCRLLASLAWQKYSAGAGSKGPRFYSWAWIALLGEDDEHSGDTGQHHLLIRRNDTTGELAYLRCYSPHPVPLATWSASPGNAGASRNPSKPPKASPA
jgi:hypothetical protein